MTILEIAFASNAILAAADAALRGLLAATAVGAGLWALRARNVKAQKAAWALVLAGAMAMPLLSPWMASQSWMPKWIPDAAALSSAAKAQVKAWTAATQVHRVEAAPMPPTASPVIQDVTPIALPVSSMQESTGQETAPAHKTASPIGPQYPAPEMLQQRNKPARVTAAEVAWTFYLAVAAALVLRLLCGLGAALELWQEGAPIELASAFPVRVHNEITSPVTIASGILLPAEFSEWEEEKLRIVLAHEGEHVRQGDFYLQLAAGLYAAIFWFSPLGWWLKRKLSDLGEAISDGAAVNEAASRAAYAGILLEFAAMPSTAQMGVAMARPGRMTERMERLLNETRFQQAFAGGRARLLAAVILAPVAVFAATAVVRGQSQQPAPAQAAPAATASAPQSAEAPATGVSHPSDEPIEAPPAPPAAPAAPAPPAAGAGVETDVAPNISVSTSVNQNPSIDISAPNVSISTSTNGSMSVSSSSNASPHTYSYSHSYSTDQDNSGQRHDSYAIIRGDGPSSFSWFSGTQEEINRIRHLAPGEYLWFKRDGKQYIVTDPEVLSRLHEIYQPVQSLSEQMKAIGKQQREEAERDRAELNKELADSGFNKAEFDKQMAGFRAKQPEFEKEMRDLQGQLAHISIPKVEPVDPKQFEELKRQMAALQLNEPDFDRKMAEINRQMATLRIPKIDIDQKKMAEINKQIGELTQKFSQDQAKMIADNTVYQIRSDAYRRLGEKMGKIGAEQGKLGGEMGRAAHDADKQIRGIIDESLKNGKAKPVQ